MELYKHQHKFAHGYKDKAFAVHEGGTGKSVCASVWLKDGRDDDALVLCPKRILVKWQETLKEWGAKATVLSKEQFKKVLTKKWSAVVVDESDEYASPLFIKGRSQLSEALYNLIKEYPDMPVFLATATPVRSSPWNLHSQLTFLGQYVDWKAWRRRFFTLEYRPFLTRPAYMPKPNWRQEMRPILEKFADIVLLKDCVGELPPVTEKEVAVKSEKFKPIDIEPAKRFVAEHRHEQLNKPKVLLEIAKDYRKVLVVAHYVEQVESLSKELAKDRQTFMIHGGVKDHEGIIKRANEADECFLVVQASLAAGWEFPSSSCVIFASLGYSARNWLQMKYRVRRINDLHPINIFYLLAGRADKAVYKQIMLGKDFLPSEWDE